MVVGQPRAHSGEVVGHPQVRWPGNLGVVGRGGRATLGGRARWAGNLGVVGQGGRATSGKVVGQPRVVGQGGRAPCGTLGGQPRASLPNKVVIPGIDHMHKNKGKTRDCQG